MDIPLSSDCSLTFGPLVSGRGTSCSKGCCSPFQHIVLINGAVCKPTEAHFQTVGVKAAPGCDCISMLCRGSTLVEVHEKCLDE